MAVPVLGAVTTRLGSGLITSSTGRVAAGAAAGAAGSRFFDDAQKSRDPGETKTDDRTVLLLVGGLVALVLLTEVMDW